jgi:hypothetical protein
MAPADKFKRRLQWEVLRDFKWLMGSWILKISSYFDLFLDQMCTHIIRWSISVNICVSWAVYREKQAENLSPACPGLFLLCLTFEFDFGDISDV